MPFSTCSSARHGHQRHPRPPLAALAAALARMAAMPLVAGVPMMAPFCLAAAVTALSPGPGWSLVAPAVPGSPAPSLPPAAVGEAPSTARPPAAAATGSSGSESPLLRLVAESFAAMRSTLYQHHTAVDASQGSYRFDCVGLVAWAVRQATPQAWLSLRQRMAIAPGRIPSPPTLVRFFLSLQQQPAPGWQALDSTAELRGGDVVSWQHRSSHASGHALILAAAPQPLAAGLWQVKVFDATSTPHLEDSRPTDPRARVFVRTGRRSGLGHGVMALVSDPGSGRLIGFRWRPQGPTVLAPIAAGRPLD